MTEKELIKKLNNLRHVQPDAAWKQQNREILLAQISNTATVKEQDYFDKLFMFGKNFVLSLPRPALAFSGLLVVLITGVAISNNTFVNPNDTLNIARIISEKAKLSFTFDETQKNKMQLEFASLHAKEIAGTLAESAVSKDGADSQNTTKLRADFKVEINKMRQSLAAKPAASATPAADADIKVSVADSGFDSKGVQVSTPKSAAASIVAATASSTVATPSNASQTLEEAEKLFNDKNYKEAADKLNQVDSLLK
jgi:hypothetical protein